MREKTTTTPKEAKARHIITLLVENHAGVLARVAALIAAKGYNIDSLTVGETMDPSISRMTLVVRGDDSVVEQAVKQLNRLIDVIRVTDLTGEEFVERELVLVKVKAKPEAKAEILRIADIFRAKVVDVAPVSYMLELTGAEDKLNAFVELLRPYGIQEFARTGMTVMTRGSKTLSKQTEEMWKEPDTKLVRDSGRGKVVGLVEKG
ncbi:MAG: acetolactate synthase small subunit [Candidatus Methylomirabilis oxygeniifera]|uniref:acetolactate synthase n=1 Tax=Methylomirabilis oxygeniifera TaxID=671143 RepID=D5MF93_METO1|nr:MAG: acetolactate synthase small subunit [Candidatus Methylomirabilis oxyfera]CBE68422.1 Acetolactate synthase small subunit (Acetohydroxy-acid synthase small subunit) (AHAS) (ALS) [Candidatus Methylomirabilis oxyfera]